MPRTTQTCASARWRSGDAADCKSVYAGSIPARASNHIADHARSEARSPKLAQLRGISTDVVRQKRLCRDAKIGRNRPEFARVSVANSASMVSWKPASLPFCLLRWLKRQALGAELSGSTYRQQSCRCPTLSSSSKAAVGTAFQFSGRTTSFRGRRGCRGGLLSWGEQTEIKS